MGDSNDKLIKASDLLACKIVNLTIKPLGINSVLVPFNLIS